MLRSGQVQVLSSELRELLGPPGEAMDAVEARAKALYPEATPIVWECDACSFQFGYVSGSAVEVLGYPSERWHEPMFWADHVVHPDDRDDAVTYCALATGKGRDHMFEYRARTADGRLVWLRDFVMVIRSADSVSLRLRGAMFDVTAEKLAEASPAPVQVPSRDELAA